MTERSIRVLYIAAWGRSGSTMLANSLAQIDGFCSIGEMYYMWDFGLIENSLCGCGAPLRQCEFWTKVLEIVGGIEHVDPYDMLRYRNAAYRTRHLPLMLTSCGGHELRRRLGRHLEDLAQIYSRIQAVTGSNVIIDSSKFPSYAYILSLIPSIDLRVVHLVRDPRAIAYSWQRRKADPGRGGASMDRVRPHKSSMLWLTWNLATEILWQVHSARAMYLRVHYEAFATRPKETVAKIAEFAGCGDAKLPFVTDTTVLIHPSHSVSGNPVRFQKGEIKIRPDLEWESRIHKRDRWLVTGLTWPLLAKYGYLKW